MSTLEEKVNTAIDLNSWLRIEEWKWIGWKRLVQQVELSELRHMHSLIRKAPLAECLTSPSEYVREYRKWWEERRRYEV
jgi:hypothetical protein